MRVLLVTNDYPPKPGGIQQYLGNLVPNLDAEVLVLAPRDEGDDAGVVRNRRRFMWPTPAGETTRHFRSMPMKLKQGGLHASKPMVILPAHTCRSPSRRTQNSR